MPSLSYDVIIPVISIDLIAIIGYFVQIVVFYLTNQKEVTRKRLDAYANF